VIAAISISLAVGTALWVLWAAAIFLLYRMGERVAALQKQVNEVQGQVNAALTSAQGGHQLAERALELVSKRKEVDFE
jgi:biopolymer transport protein ExbB/TolQ